MTSTSSPSTPEHAPVLSPLSDSERAVYSLATVEQWRVRQQGILAGLREAALADIEDESYINTFNDNIDGTLDDFLSEQGIDNTSPNYAEVRKLFRDSSIDKVHDSEWYASPASRGENADDTVSERDKVAIAVSERTGTAGSSDPAVDEVETNEREQFEADLKENIDKYAKELAKRSREVVTWGEGKSMTEYREELTDLIGGLATEMMLDYFDDDTKDWKPGQKDIAVAAIDKFVGEQMEKLVGSLETAYGEYDKKRSVVTQYLMRKWGEWGPSEDKVTWRERVFDKGTLKKSVPFIVGGATVGAVGWLLLPVVGAVGAGVAIGAGIGAKFASAIGRSYARIKLDSAADADNKGQERAKQLYAMMSAQQDSSHEELLKLASETANDYRNRNRVRMLSSAAIAAATSGGVAALIDQLVPGDFNGLFAKPIESVRKWWEGNNPTGERSTSPVPPRGGEGSADDTPSKAGGSGEHTQVKDSVHVESGSGLIREMKQSADAAGYDIDGKTATKLYQAVRKEFGNDGIIDIKGVSDDTYLAGNDLRLSAPGKAVWKDGVSDFMEKWLADHGDAGGVVESNEPAVDAIPETSPTPKSVSIEGVEAVERLQQGVPDIYSTEARGERPYTIDFDGNGTVDGYLSPYQAENLSKLTDIRAGDTLTGSVENITNYAGLKRLSDEKLGALLDSVGRQLSGMRYEGTLVPITHYDNIAQKWVLNVPENVRHPQLPDAAVRAMAREIAGSYRAVA